MIENRRKIIEMMIIVLTYKKIEAMVLNLKSHNRQLDNPGLDLGFTAMLVHEYRQME